MILITKHVQPPTSPDAQLILDIDLSILGQLPELFETYEKRIRLEYSWVSAEDYKIGRAKVLNSFLDRPLIYNTDRFVKLYEHQAIENIIKALSALTL